MSTVGIYAECSALSPEEPRHYNQHKAKHLLTTNRFHTTSTCVCRLCGTSSRTDPRPKTTIPPHAFAASAEPTPHSSPQQIYLYRPFLFNCMTMHQVEVGGVSQETLTRRFPRPHPNLGSPPTTWPNLALLQPPGQVMINKHTYLYR